MIKSRLDRIRREQHDLHCAVLHKSGNTVAVLNLEISEAVFYEVLSNPKNRVGYIGRELFTMQRGDLGEVSFKRLVERVLEGESND